MKKTLITFIFFQYSSIYVETPSGARIAQWLNVSNTNGLIHKELQLIDEPEEGTYLISVTAAPGTKRVVKAFRIQDFVLPRFEMIITKPKYLLATDKSASFKVCTTYTFGQPVRGKLTGTIDNGGWRRSKVKLAIKEDVFGCADINVPLDDLKVNDRDFYVYRINLNVKFEEDGTGNVEEKSDSITVTRTVLTLMPTDYAPYKKAELPWTNVASILYIKYQYFLMELMLFEQAFLQLFFYNNNSRTSNFRSFFERIY